MSEPRYRRKWQRYVQRAREGELSQSGVAGVLAHHVVWELGEHPADEESALARGEMRHKVRRALRGDAFAAGTLELFIDAFEMTDADADRLWAAFAATDAAQTGDDGIAHTVPAPRPMVRRQWHRTVALFERYHIDAAGHVAHRRTLHTIVALEDGVDSYLFNHEESVARIEVAHGGRLGRHFEYGGGLHSDEIVFGRVLKAGERMAMEYHTHYRRPALPVTEVRRPARAKAENIDIALQFTAGRVPERIWWSVWADHLDGGPVSDDPVAPDAAASVRRFVPSIEQTVVGFRWTWG